VPASAAAHQAAAAEAQRRREAWLASLPPEEREAILEAERAAWQMNLAGLYQRNVQ